MTTYIIRRLLLFVPTLFGITLLTFLLIRLSPINAALIRGGGGEGGSRSMTAEQRQEIIKLYGLDQPPLTAYGHWVVKVMHGDLGDSFTDHRPVIAKIGERIGLTVSITGTALI